MSENAITDVSPVLKKAVKDGFILDGNGLYDAPVALFYDLDLWDAHITKCNKAFGNTFRHMVAMKSNPVSKFIKRIHEMHGFGVECASIGEIQHAIQHCKIPKEKVIFDSPCKTLTELEYVIKEKIHMNIDNFEEFEYARDYINNQSEIETGIIGIRLNPLVGAGEIEALSVSTKSSKFGIPLTEKERMIDCFKTCGWLNSVHVHVGSGGMGLTLLSTGIKVAVQFAKEINALLKKQQITSIDIGGGLPANYLSDEWASAKVPVFSEYAQHLRKEIPELFSGEFKVFTEFGQSIHAKCGFLASRIQWKKDYGAKPIHIIHFGADCCVRQAYTKDHKRRIEAYQADGCKFPNDEEMVEQDIAGPLCFQGDFIGKDIKLPKRLKSRDIIVLKDCGANTISLFSRHCSRLCPPVYGYMWDSNGEDIKEIVIMKPREKVEEVSNFWGSL